MSDPKLIDIAAELQGETSKAYRIFDGMRTEWVPKSQVAAYHIRDTTWNFIMPEWLAQEKGFI